MIPCLPNDTVIRISKYLTLQTYINMSTSICRWWNISFINDVYDLVWIFYLKRDFSVKHRWQSWTVRNMYKTLYRYRFMFGYFKRVDICYGGLYKVEIRDQVGIVINECLPPYIINYKPIKDLIKEDLIEFLPDVPKEQHIETDVDRQHLMRFRKVYALQPSSTDGVSLKAICWQSLDGLLNDVSHSHWFFSLLRDDSDNPVLTKTSGGFKFVCHCPDHHLSMGYYNFAFGREIGLQIKDNNYLNKEIEEDQLQKVLNSIDKFYQFDRKYYHVIKKFDTLARLSFSPEFEGIDLNYITYSHHQLFSRFKPGLFQGSYHNEAEFFSLQYAGNKIIGTKISGDPELVSGEVVIEIDLLTPLTFSKKEQKSWYSFTRAHRRQKRNRNFANNCLSTCSKRSKSQEATQKKQLQPQSFRVPSNWIDNEVARDQCIPNIPEICLERYDARASIVQNRSVQNTTAIWALFDENTFAILWPIYQDFIMFYRIKNI